MPAIPAASSMTIISFGTGAFIAPFFLAVIRSEQAEQGEQAKARLERRPSHGGRRTPGRLVDVFLPSDLPALPALPALEVR